MEDFRYYFADEKEIDAFVAAEETLKGPEQRIQIARMRRAWAAVRQYMQLIGKRPLSDSSIKRSCLSFGRRGIECKQPP